MKINLDFNQIESITIYSSNVRASEDGDVTYFFNKKQAIEWTKGEMKRLKKRGNPERFIMEETFYPSTIKEVDIHFKDDDDEEEKFTIKNS